MSVTLSKEAFTLTAIRARSSESSVRAAPRNDRTSVALVGSDATVRRASPGTAVARVGGARSDENEGFPCGDGQEDRSSTVGARRGPREGNVACATFPEVLIRPARYKRDPAQGGVSSSGRGSTPSVAEVSEGYVHGVKASTPGGGCLEARARPAAHSGTAVAEVSIAYLRGVAVGEVSIAYLRGEKASTLGGGCLEARARPAGAAAHSRALLFDRHLPSVTAPASQRERAS